MLKLFCILLIKWGLYNIFIVVMVIILFVISVFWCVFFVVVVVVKVWEWLGVVELIVYVGCIEGIICDKLFMLVEVIKLEFVWNFIFKVWVLFLYSLVRVLLEIKFK